MLAGTFSGQYPLFEGMGESHSSPQYYYYGSEKTVFPSLMDNGGEEAMASPPCDFEHMGTQAGYPTTTHEQAYMVPTHSQNVPRSFNDIQDTQGDYSATTHHPIHEQAHPVPTHFSSVPRSFNVDHQHPEMHTYAFSSPSEGTSISRPGTSASVAVSLPDPQTVEESHGYDFVPNVSPDIITNQMERTKVEGKTRHRCKICGKDYSNCSNLRNHIHTEHCNNKAPWQCVTCKKKFSSQSSARRHKKSVDAPRTHCPQCNKTVSRKDYLKGYHATACKGMGS